LVSYCNNFLVEFLGGNTGGDVQDNILQNCWFGNILANQSTTYGVYLLAGSAGRPDGTRMIGCTWNSSIGTALKTSKAGLASGPDFLMLGCSTQAVPVVFDIDGPASKIIGNRFEVVSGAISATYQSTANYGVRIANSWGGTVTITDNTAFGRPVSIGEDISGTMPLNINDTAGLQFFETADVATPDLYVARVWKWTISNANAKTVAAPVKARTGDFLMIDVLNSSGGVMGAITWNAVFKLAGAFTNPANTKRRTISFYYDGTNWVETNRAAADI
jgi:hypothetical protein